MQRQPQQQQLLRNNTKQQQQRQLSSTRRRSNNRLAECNQTNRRRQRRHRVRAVECLREWVDLEHRRVFRLVPILAAICRDIHKDHLTDRPSPRKMVSLTV